MADSKKYDGSQWEHSLRKLTTATEAVENPLYSDGTPITNYTIKGNTEQNGTPTPSNPVEVQGVGTLDSGQYKIPISSGGVTTNIYLGSTQTVRAIKKLVLGDIPESNWVRVQIGDNMLFIAEVAISDKKYGVPEELMISDSYTIAAGRYNILNGQITTYNQINNNQLVVCNDTYTTVSDFYAANKDVAVWYVLATEKIGIVNEPLMKVGDYADTLSNATAIPTTEGANSITVDTTVQPSEFTATWTGWHNASVKEYDGSDWQ